MVRDRRPSKLDAFSFADIMTEYAMHGDLDRYIQIHGPLGLSTKPSVSTPPHETYIGERDARWVMWQLLQGLEVDIFSLGDIFMVLNEVTGHSQAWIRSP